MNSDPIRLAMWSGPRNLSTAMMYAFAARGDCAVWDEPFYAAYLRATGIDHPMASEVIAAHDSDAGSVAAACAGPVPGALPVWYQKHMTLHMIPQFDRRFLHACSNVFLIRHPARVVASYARKREGPSLADLGFARQADLFDEVAGWSGAAPLVIDSADILRDPAGMLARLCAAVNIPYTPAMLSWPPGPKGFDGVWAAHWYGAVHRSSGFDAAEGALPDLPPDYARLAEAAMPHYDRLAQYRLG